MTGPLPSRRALRFLALHAAKPEPHAWEWKGVDYSVRPLVDGTLHAVRYTGEVRIDRRGRLQKWRQEASVTRAELATLHRYFVRDGFPSVNAKGRALLAEQGVEV